MTFDKEAFDKELADASEKVYLTQTNQSLKSNKHIAKVIEIVRLETVGRGDWNQTTKTGRLLLKIHDILINIYNGELQNSFEQETR